MPSPFAHVAAGYVLYRAYGQKLPEKFRPLFGIPSQLLILAGISLLPDLDAIPGVLLGDFGRYHHNLSHSLAAGLLAALLIASLIAWKHKGTWLPWFGAALLAYDLHLLLDIFTSDRGLMLLWPFTQARFSSTVKFFYGVQWGLGLISIWHVWTIFTELLFFLVIWVIVKLYQLAKSRFVPKTSYL